MPDIIYYKIHEKKKKQAEKVEKRKYEFLGLRRDERTRVLNELLKFSENYSSSIPINELKNKIYELIEKDFEKPRRFCWLSL